MAKKHWNNSQNTAMPWTNEISATFTSRRSTKHKQSRRNQETCSCYLISLTPHSPDSLLGIICASGIKWLSSHFDLISFEDQMQTGNMHHSLLCSEDAQNINNSNRVSNKANSNNANHTWKGLCVRNKSIKWAFGVSRWQHRPNFLNLPANGSNTA